MKKHTSFGEFARYTTFNVLGMISLSCYILADTYFVSKSLGANGLAALNLAIPVYSFINGSGLMFGMGGATQYSILKSQEKKKAASGVFTSTVVLTILVSLVFALMGISGSGLLTHLLGANPEIYEMSKTYLQVILLFAPFFMMNNVLICFVRNDGEPPLSMAAMLGGSLSNILLDYLFMFPFGMGIFGAVLATGIAPMVSMLILSTFFLKKRNHFHFLRCGVFQKRAVSILSSGLPSLITEVSSGIVMIVFNSIILKLQGNVGIAAYGIIANLSLVILSIYTGIAQGVQPLLSKYHGVGRKEEVQVVFRYALWSMFIVSAILYGFLFFGAEGITTIFNSEKNPLLQSIAVPGIRIYFIACAFAGYNIINAVYFTSTESVRPAHLISILRGFVIIIPLALLLSTIGGMLGVWLVFPVTEGIVALVGVVLSLILRISKH